MGIGTWGSWPKKKKTGKKLAKLNQPEKKTGKIKKKKKTGKKLATPNQPEKKNWQNQKKKKNWQKTGKNWQKVENKLAAKSLKKKFKIGKKGLGIQNSP